MPHPHTQGRITVPSYPVHRDADIVGAITETSTNIKTGDMQQLYIMSVSVAPHVAVKLGLDTTVCGDCPLRSKASGGSGDCYVATVHGPRVVWTKTKDMTVEKLRQSTKPIRLGAYGDPAFLPIELIADIVRNRRWTGYTHQWHRRTKKWSRYLMASIDDKMAKRQRITSKQLKDKAVAKGYRTFRIIRDASELDSDEIMCPNYTKGVQCVDCGLCNGSKGADDKRKNIAIVVHGSSAKLY